MNDHTLDELYNEDSNHFVQIQMVINKIIGDKDSLNKFSEITSIEERYNFTLSICKNMSIDPKYSQNEFSQFQLFTDIFHEIGRKPELSQQFNDITNLNEIFDFMDQFAQEYNLGSNYKKDAFERFLYAISYNTKLIPQEQLKHISAGNQNKDFLDNLLEVDKTFTGIYSLGAKIGKLISISRSYFESLNKDK